MPPASASTPTEVLQNPQTSSSDLSTSLAINELLLRMRGGDRGAAAEFVMRYGSRIRRRIRGKLGPSIRRLFDSLEILSTLGRRLDLYVMSGRLQASNEAQLWSLVGKMADRALIDKARVFKRLQAVEREDSQFAQALASRLRIVDGTQPMGGAELEIDNCLRALDDGVDRQILSLWLAGETHLTISEVVSIGPDAVYKRWERIKSQLRERLVAAPS
ncbi:MAG: ECF-type sigma factor [Phycisphaerales bacterium]|nr:ECF-type sigma factor [Phycisphaerales bacterium]MCI0630145.1 ECF-type sigma factor [Phycisphaerales bacterium]